MRLVCIGDVHGKTKEYQKIVRRLPEGQPSVQLGDVGIGFPGVGLHKMAEHHQWFRGNHDNPEKCRATTNYIGAGSDWGFKPELSLFWMAGAFSIDRGWRTEGVDWWPDEQLSYDELGKAIDAYIAAKPRYMLSHEAPTKVGMILLADLIGPYFAAKGECPNSRTAQALQSMFESHKPEEWVFGHYHVDKSLELNGPAEFPWRTKFTCVAELSQYELEINPEKLNHGAPEKLSAGESHDIGGEG